MVDGVNNSNNANNIKYNKDLQTKTYLKNTCRNMSIFTKTSKINQKTFEAVNNRNENKDTINESDIKELKSAFNEGCEDAKTTTNEKGEQVTQCADGTSMTTFDNDATNTHSVSINANNFADTTGSITVSTSENKDQYSADLQLAGRHFTDNYNYTQNADNNGTLKTDANFNLTDSMNPDKSVQISHSTELN